MKKEPIRHHYIPQFILRNFCFDDNRTRLLYYDKKSSKISARQTREIFMARNLYRDNINSPNEPMRIEKDMARFESEISQIITKKFLNKGEILISLDEDEKLKVFFAIMAFRLKITSSKFGAEASEDSKSFYSVYQKNGDLSDFWKRNLGYLVNCRSLKEILNHKKIDDPIKIFFHRDISGLFGLYFIVAERRGPLDFIISDSYPTVITGITDKGLELCIYSVFPISPDRIILLTANGAESAPKKVATFSNDILRKPKLNPDRKSITIRTKKIYENEVRYINSVLMKEAHEGFAFRNKDRIEIPT